MTSPHETVNAETKTEVRKNHLLNDHSFKKAAEGSERSRRNHRMDAFIEYFGEWPREYR